MNTSSTPRGLKKILSGKFGDLSNVAILAGAGISLDHPSRLPAAYPIMHAVVDALAPTSEIRDALRIACSADRNDLRGPNNFLRMERLLSLVYHSGSMPRAIGELATAESPNDLHFALAHMASLGAIILTTNFDCLIEKACEELGMPWRLVVDDKDYEQLLSQSPGQDVCLIVKLHGSADRPSSIQTTLDQVGRGRLGWSAEKSKGAAIRDILTRRNLLVLGYSGSDDFDVVPCLLQTPSSRAILWVEHDESKQLTDALLQRADQTGPPSRSGDVLLRMTQPRMDGASVRDSSCAWKVSIATREILRHWYGEKRHDEHPRSDVGARVMSLLREDCAARYALESHKWLDAAVLFDEIEDSTSALACARHGRDVAIRSNDVPARATFAALLGRLLRGRGEIKSAAPLFDEARALAEEMGDSATLSIALTGKADILHQLGRVDEEVKTLKKVIALERTLDKPGWLANSYGQLAIALSETDFESALKYHRLGLEIARDSGDMRAELSLLNNFKLLMGMQVNDPQVMVELERAEELAASLGHLRGLVEVMGNRGIVLSDRGQWDSGLELMAKAEKLAISLDYPEGAARWKSEAADIVRKRGNLEKAREMLESVLSVWNKVMDQREKGVAHGRLGLICQEQQDYNDALMHLQAALEIDEAAGWTHGVIDDLGNLGRLFQEAGHFDQAYQYFSDAVLKARACKYQAALARNLGNLGMELSRKGRHEEALKCDLEALDINIKLGNLEGEAYTRRNIAGDWLQFRKVPEAIDELRKAYELAGRLGISRLSSELKHILNKLGYPIR